MEFFLVFLNLKLHDESRSFENSSRKVFVLLCYLWLAEKATPTPPIAHWHNHTSVLHLASQISSQNKGLFRVFNFTFLMKFLKKIFFLNLSLKKVTRLSFSSLSYYFIWCSIYIRSRKVRSTQAVDQEEKTYELAQLWSCCHNALYSNHMKMHITLKL